jgi:hypothetical protein
MRTAAHRLALATCAVLVSGAVAAADPLPRRGELSGIFSWYVSNGQNLAVDKDHILWGGVASGPFLNQNGSGFLHGAAAACTFSGEFKKDTVTHNSGDCVATDADGDKVTLVWKCTACPGSGEIRWTSGTGKYAGIKGSGTFQQNDAGPMGSNMGWSVWKAKWELP